MNTQLYTEEGTLHPHLWQWFTRGGMWVREGDKYAPPATFPSFAAREAFWLGCSHEERYGCPTGEDYAV